MNLIKFIFYFLVLHHFSAMAICPSVASKSSEKDFSPEKRVHGDCSVPVSFDIKFNRIGQLDFLPEVEQETDTAFLSVNFLIGKTEVDLSPGQLYFARRIVPSLNTLTIIYPFHSFP